MPKMTDGHTVLDITDDPSAIASMTAMGWEGVEDAKPATKAPRKTATKAASKTLDGVVTNATESGKTN